MARVLELCNEICGMGRYGLKRAMKCSSRTTKEISALLRLGGGHVRM